MYVSGLRKLVGKERLQTRAPGYVLGVERGDSTSPAFATPGGRRAGPEALALWRGPPLSDFAYSRFAQAEIARLERSPPRLPGGAHRQDLERRTARRADRGAGGAPGRASLRERLRGQLMLALYRSGRQAEALEAYQEARRTLVDELGIEPGRELRELHQAILNQDPALDVAKERLPPTHPENRTLPVAEAHASGTPERQMRKTISALFVDVRIVADQDRKLDPEALRRVAIRTLDLVETAAGHHGGVFETVAGTAVTIAFGLPAVHEDDALRAVQGRD